MTEDEVVAELRDGMTIGIGGWGVAAQADVAGPGDPALRR